MAKKARAKKTLQATVYEGDGLWKVRFGVLKRRQGNPGKTEHLFRVVGEKLPFESLEGVRKHLLEEGLGVNGVYVAHDSMGFPRYIGRGAIFNRLKARKVAQKLELIYFSFYVVSEKKHEREIETLLIRAAGPLLQFNTKKKRVSIMPGDVNDYEPGTYFYERKYEI